MMESWTAFLFVSAAVASSIIPPPIPLSPGTSQIVLSTGNDCLNAGGILNGPTCLSAFDHTVRKYELMNTMKTPSDVVRRGGHTTEVQLSAIQNDDAYPKTIYHGIGFIGKDPGYKPFVFDFDTSVWDVMVPGSICSECFNDVDRFSPSRCECPQGVNASHRFRTRYLTGTTLTEMITVGDLHVRNQTILSLHSATDGKYPRPVIGLSNTRGVYGFANSSFFSNLISEHQVKNREFGFYFGRTESGTAEASELTLGGHDKDKFESKPVSIPVDRENRYPWLIHSDAMTIDGVPVEGSAGGASVDTGSPYIIVPHSVAKKLFEAIPGSRYAPVHGRGFWQYPCSAKPRVAFMFQKTQFWIDPRDFNAGLANSMFLQGSSSGTNDTTKAGEILRQYQEEFPRLCVSSIVSIGRWIGPDYVVGRPFLRAWYSIFNHGKGHNKKPTVSFARAVDSLESSRKSYLDLVTSSGLPRASCSRVASLLAIFISLSLLQHIPIW